jgi:outer membrane protein OmpA-like peptidoglycan-associated protein
MLQYASKERIYPPSCKKVWKLKTQKSDEKLEQLKALLLAPELETLRQTVEALHNLELHCDNPDAVIARVKPVFDTILAKNLKDKDSRTVELIAQYLADIIHEATKKDLPSLSRSLQHVIGPAIAKEIADNRETMVDTLYPIMGGMISKYVTQAIKELMENINRKIEDGLSTERIKRKIKAKLTGVSETELLLEESTDARILALFIIHKPTGLLIASAQLDENVIDDPHMVAAMASAVKDFINDAVHLQKEFKEEVQIVSYADATLYIESAGSVYLIAFLDNEPDYELRGKINAFFATLVKKYADFFRGYDGDESRPEAAELRDRIESFLFSEVASNLKERKSSGFNPAKWILIALFSLLAAYVIRDVWERYRLERLEDEARRLGIENARLTEINASALRLEGFADSASHTKKAVRILSRRSGKTIVPAALLKPESIERRYAQLDDRLRRLAQRLGTLSDETNDTDSRLKTLRSDYESAFVSYRRKTGELEKENEILRRRLENLEKKLARMTFPDRVKQAVDEAMKNSPYYIRESGKLNFAKLRLFLPGETKIREEKQALFLQEVYRYLDVLCRYASSIEAIRIEAFSDTSGDANKNLLLTKKRAEYVSSLLKNDERIKRCFDTTKFEAVGYGERFPVIVDGKEDANASRLIEIGYRLVKPSEE